VHRTVHRVVAVLSIALFAVPGLTIGAAGASPGPTSAHTGHAAAPPLDYGYFATYRDGATTPTITTVTGGLSAGVSNGGLYITRGDGHYDVISNISKVGQSDYASISLPLPAGIGVRSPVLPSRRST